MEIFTILIIAGVAAAIGYNVALGKNRDALAWMFICGLFPLAVLIILVMADIPTERD